MSGIRRQHGTKPLRTAAPLELDPLGRLIEPIDTSTLAGVRDSAVLLLGFAAALRRSELVALDVEDLEFDAARGLGARRVSGVPVPSPVVVLLGRQPSSRGGPIIHHHAVAGAITRRRRAAAPAGEFNAGLSDDDPPPPRVGVPFAVTCWSPRRLSGAGPLPKLARRGRLTRPPDPMNACSRPER